MNQEIQNLPVACRQALAAIELNPLDLEAESSTHLQHCAACAETRVQWLAQEHVAQALAPAGYFENLPARVLRKLPARPKPVLARPYLWAAAAMLLGAATLGGFMAGRANRNPVVEAGLPRTPAEIQEVNLPDAPFHEKEEVLTEMEQLSAEQVKALVDKLIAPADLHHYKPEQVVVACTGSQGEPQSGLL